LLAAYLGCTPTGGWDIWWHLQSGELALERLSTLPTDPFSHTFGGQPWGHKDLLADVLLFLGFDGLGFAWFALLKALVVAGIGLAVYGIGRRRGVSVTASALVAGLAVVAVEYRLVERPILFSLALFPLLVLLLYRLRDRAAAVSARELAGGLTPVVALLWIWAWLHREAIVGIGLFGLHVCGHWISRLTAPPGERPTARFLAAASLALGASMLLPLLSPSGWHFYESAFFAARSEALRAVISDWARIGPLELLRDFPATALLAVLALPGAMLAVTRSSRAPSGPNAVSLGQVAALVFFALMSLLDSVRWIPYLSLLGAVLVLEGLADERRLLGRVAVRVFGPRLALPLVLVLVLGAAALLNNRGLGLGPMPDRYPDGAVAFAREHGLSGKVANAFHLGGYLIWELWPETLVAIDGRNDVVYPPEFLLEAIESQRRAEVFERMREQDGASWVVAGNLPGQSTHTFLARDAGWMLVYWSEAAVIYARRRAHTPLARYELRHVDPSAVDKAIVHATRRALGSPEQLDEIGEEVHRMLTASPRGLRANTAAALYFHLRGPEYHSRRDELLARIESLFPEHPAVAELRRRIGGE
jgi:hypothetical protein